MAQQTVAVLVLSYVFKTGKEEALLFFTFSSFSLPYLLLLIFFYHNFHSILVFNKLYLPFFF